MGKESAPQSYTRREFLKRVGSLGVVLLSSSCGRLLEKVSEGSSPKIVASPTPEAPTLAPTPTEIPAPTETPQKIIVLNSEADLVDLAEIYPLASFADDPYYPWYCLNGGEKLFDPWAIPAGTSLLIPEEAQELPAPCGVEIKEQEWQYTLSENSTSLGQSSEARLRNIRTAVQRLNDKVVAPYKLFSILEAIGPFNEESREGDEGYGWGFGYTDEGEVKMFAGGICQVPSTLFKASAQAGMLVIQRTAHLYHWANYGAWDATIADGVDFTFRNLFDFPVKIEAAIKDNRLAINIKSPKPNPYESIVCETLYDRKNDDGSWDGLVRQTVTFKGRTRVREYSSHYEPKP